MAWVKFSFGGWRRSCRQRNDHFFAWPAGSTRLFWKIALWMVGLKFLASVAEAWFSPTPQWVRSGFWPILLILVYQGVFVGLSEEMMIRPALHRPLLLRFPSEMRLGRLRLSHAWLLTSLLFGAFHLPNALLGQSLGSTLAQAVMAAVVGGIIGYYYEQTSNYLGAALLHGMLDGASYVAFGALSIFVLGLIFGFVVLKSRSVAGGMIAHGINNFFSVL